MWNFVGVGCIGNDEEVLPEEVRRDGLDAFERIGEDTTEVLERRPASLVVARIIKPKFVRKGRDRAGATEVLAGDTPALPIARGLAGPGLLADTRVRDPSRQKGTWLVPPLPGRVAPPRNT